MEQKFKIETKGPLFDGSAPQIIEDTLYAAASEMVLFLEGEVRKNTPVGVYGAQGGLLAGIAGEVQRGEKVVMGTVFHQSVYGDVVELGRSPGAKMPPKGSLLRWLEVKLGVSPREAERIEFVVRRKIGQKGFPGAAMFQKALDEGEPTLRDIAEKYGLTLSRTLSGES